MKTIKTFLVLCMSFFFLFCSKQEINKDWCNEYWVLVSDNCDCTIGDNSCHEGYRISKAEYFNLFGILNDSTEPCTYIYSKEFNTGVDFEGYLIKLNLGSCVNILY